MFSCFNLNRMLQSFTLIREGLLLDFIVARVGF